MEIAVKLTLKLDTNEYEVNLALPNGKLTDDAPFKFAVEQMLFKPRPDAEKDNPAYKLEPTGDKDTLLQVAVGAEKSVYVAVQPPHNLLVTAGVGDIVKDLKVLVANGNFNTTSKKFEALPAG